MNHSQSYEKNKHLIGQTVNNWTILDLVTSKNKHHTFARAQCRCGTIQEVRLTYLLNNKVKDCGCGQKARRREATIAQYQYLIDSSMHDWTVLQIIPPDEKHHNTYVMARCKCGTVKEVRLSYLTSGRSKNCGCGRKQMLQNKAHDLVGRRFGKLTVIEKLDERNKYGRIIYRCKCDCGNEVDVLGNSLTTYHTTSCGCIVSYWNLHIERFLESIKIKFNPEYAVKIDGRTFWFDFYLPDFNLCIEYDGIQHYEPIGLYGSDLESQLKVLERTQERDHLKNQYCIEHNINLLRIPYWETKNIETIINNCLQRLNEKGSVYTEYATV